MDDREKTGAWMKWLYLAWAMLWLINLAIKLSHYFRRLGRGVPLEQLTDARFDCVIAAFMAALGLVTFFLLHLPLQRLWSRIIGVALMAAVTAGWAVTYPLAEASGYPPFFWWTILAVLVGVTIYGIWKYLALKRKMRSSEEDEII